MKIFVKKDVVQIKRKIDEGNGTFREMEKSSFF